jgi:hypothetical protein
MRDKRFHRYRFSWVAAGRTPGLAWVEVDSSLAAGAGMIAAAEEDSSHPAKTL